MKDTSRSRSAVRILGQGLVGGDARLSRDRSNSAGIVSLRFSNVMLIRAREEKIVSERASDERVRARGGEACEPERRRSLTHSKNIALASLFIVRLPSTLLD